MALFITRALAHTNARPAGLTLQTGATTVPSTETISMVISLRDSSHRTVPDAPLDLFYAPTRRLAFNSNGTCTSRAEPDAGGDPCEIDLDDELTDEDGNLVYDLFANDDLVLWAWTGDIGDRFDLDETTYVSVEITALEPATDILVTDDLHPEAIKVPYGASVNFTLQLVDRFGDPVNEEDVRIQIRIEETRDRDTTRRRTKTYFTDDSGEIEFPYSVVDPGSRSNDQDTEVTIELLDISDLDVLDDTAVGVVGDHRRTASPLPWSGEGRDPHALVLELKPEYNLASNSGRGGRGRVTAMLVDQYGDPVSGKEIHFKSGDMAGLWQDTDDPALAKDANRETTNRRGEATVSYFRRSNDPVIEEINAFYAVGDPDGALTVDHDNDPNTPLQANTETDDILTDGDPDTDGRQPYNHYWVAEVPDDGEEYVYTLEIHDEDRRTLVLRDDTPSPAQFFVVKYDRNDQYNYDTETEEYETWVKELEEGDTIRVRVRSHNPNRVNRFDRS